MVIILGLGFTGRRLARRLLQRGECVFAAARNPARFRDLTDAGLTLSELALDRPGIPPLPKRAVLVDLIPSLPEPENTALREVIRELQPRRIVYVSSTAVYGPIIDVDAGTPAAPHDDRGRRRLSEERWIAAGPWASLILRSAAIYGPGRGVHVALREGKAPRSWNSGVVSRVHVEDLATIIQAGIAVDLQGSWPVADDEPCSSAELLAECAKLLKMLELPGISKSDGMTGRRVDGKRICEVLGIKLLHSSWRTGIPASLEEEIKKELSG